MRFTGRNTISLCPIDTRALRPKYRSRALRDPPHSARHGGQTVRGPTPRVRPHTTSRAPGSGPALHRSGSVGLLRPAGPRPAALALRGPAVLAAGAHRPGLERATSTPGRAPAGQPGGGDGAPPPPRGWRPSSPSALARVPPPRLKRPVRP